MDNEKLPGPFRQDQPLILASKSPRRRNLLKSLGLEFDVLPSSIEEPGRSNGETPQDYALRLARLKAKDVRDHRSRDGWVLAADTIVVLDDEIIGKPKGPEDARKMLRALTGRMHIVHTGCCLLGSGLSGKASIIEEEFVVTSRVWLARPPDELIEAYVATGEPLDKAGSYAIQGMGAFMVDRIEGSYTNVVGLPLREVVDLLLKYSIVMPR